MIEDKGINQAISTMYYIRDRLNQSNSYQFGAADERAKIVAWLKSEAQKCDCFARDEGECACGAWNDYKTVPMERIIDAIEAGEHLK